MTFVLFRSFIRYWAKWRRHTSVRYITHLSIEKKKKKKGRLYIDAQQQQALLNAVANGVLYSV